jgi:hypothetical protein
VEYYCLADHYSFLTYLLLFRAQPTLVRPGSFFVHFLHALKIMGLCSEAQGQTVLLTAGHRSKLQNTHFPPKCSEADRNPTNILPVNQTI